MFYVVLSAVAGNSFNFLVSGLMIFSFLLLSTSFSLILSTKNIGAGIKEDTPYNIGKKHNTAILLNWTHNVCGIMLVTIMFTD